MFKKGNQKKIYLAGGWQFRNNIKKIKATLSWLGFNVISGWIERENRVNTPEDYAKCSKLDIDEVCECDVLFAVMDDPIYTYRGTYSEIGCALGLGKQVVILCDGTSTKIDDNTYEFSHYCMRNVFYWHPLITHTTNLEDVIKELNKK